MDEAFLNQFFERGLRQAVNVKSLAARHQRKTLHALNRAVRVHTVEGFRIVLFAYLRLRAADRTVRGRLCRPALGEVLRNLRNDHIGLVDPNAVAYAEF